MKTAYDQRDERFGNARFVRNLFEQTVGKAQTWTQAIEMVPPLATIDHQDPSGQFHLMLLNSISEKKVHFDWEKPFVDIWTRSLDQIVAEINKRFDG